jgi:hypothetical protein
MKTNEQNKSPEADYVIDLTKLHGSGEFPCPGCGNEISPKDDKDKNYQILQPQVEDGTNEVTSILIQCRCKKTLRLKCRRKNKIF